jgi:DNA-binding transcriptional LysR family regulator
MDPAQTKGNHMQLEYLHEFIVIADTLNLTEAAAKLYTTQPVLSRHLRSLEDEVGAQLISRDTHGMELTGVGKMAYQEFARILSIYDGVIDKATRMSADSSGALSVGIPYYCLQYANEILPSFLRAYPDIDLNQISFQPSYAYDALAKDRIDIAMLFRHEYPGSERLRFHDFAEERLVVAMAAGNPLAEKDSLAWSDLEGSTFIVFRHNYFSSFIQQRLGQMGATPAGTVATDSIDTLAYALAEHGGVTVEPASVQHMSHEGMAFVPIVDEMDHVPMTFATRADNPNPAIPMFLKHVDTLYPDRPQHPGAGD